MELKYYEGEKYYCGITNLKSTLDKYGVAVIPNIVSNEECDKLYSEMWDFFEYITQTWTKPIRRDDQSSWREFYNLFPLHSMLIQHHGIGHAQFAWNARQNEAIIDVFTNIWKCNKEDLLVSFDGSSFHLPPEITGRGWYRHNTWYHTDQSYCRNDFECVQSFLSVNDINIGDGTLAFMEGSHKYHKEFAEHFKIIDKSDWYKFNEEEELFYASRGCEYKRITCPRGSLVLWDSRLAHCGAEPMKERSKPNIRAVIYLCYMPRSFNSDIKKKREAFEKLRTTNHWPCKPKLFPLLPRTYGKTIQPTTQIPKPHINELGMKMIGY